MGDAVGLFSWHAGSQGGSSPEQRSKRPVQPCASVSTPRSISQLVQGGIPLQPPACSSAGRSVACRLWQPKLPELDLSLSLPLPASPGLNICLRLDACIMYLQAAQ